MYRVMCPLYVFDEYGDEYDAEVHRANLDYFEEHPALLRKIKKVKCDTGKNKKALLANLYAIRAFP